MIKIYFNYQLLIFVCENIIAKLFIKIYIFESENEKEYDSTVNFRTYVVLKTFDFSIK